MIRYNTDQRQRQNSGRRFQGAVIFPVIAAIAFLCATVEAQPPTKFDFGTGAAAPGYTKVTPTTTYSTALGYGFEGGTVTAVSRGGSDVLRGDYCTGTAFNFSVTLPQGYYLVTLYLGDISGTSTTSVYGEQRRMFHRQAHNHIGAGHYQTFTIARRAYQNATVTIDPNASGIDLR